MSSVCPNFRWMMMCRQTPVPISPLHWLRPHLSTRLHPNLLNPVLDACRLHSCQSQAGVGHRRKLNPLPQVCQQKTADCTSYSITETLSLGNSIWCIMGTHCLQTVSCSYKAQRKLYFDTVTKLKHRQSLFSTNENTSHDGQHSQFLCFTQSGRTTLIQSTCRIII